MPENASDKSRQRLIDEYTEIARLAGALAHEIKSPLSTIRLTMEVLTEDLAEPETERERRTLNMAKTVVTQCRRLENILNQFLMFAKAPAVKPTPSDLNTEVRTIVDFYREKAKQKNIDFLLPTDVVAAEYQNLQEEFELLLQDLSQFRSQFVC